MLKFISKKLKKHWLLSLIAGLSLLCFLSVLIPPVLFWPSVLSSYAIPGMLIVALILFIFFIVFNRRLLILPLIVLILGLPFLIVTVNFSRREKNTNDSISILSFNTKLFRKRKTYGEFSGEMIKWVSNDTSDIKCLQEYSTNDRWPALDITNQISSKGYQYYVHKAKVKDADHNPGLAIFTKFDILHSGIVWENYGSINAGIYIDVKRGQDTLRIYNVHLESMKLELGQFKNSNNYWEKVKGLISKLKLGAVERHNQTNILLSHTDKCPYPFIICGDFNETPYSYMYMVLRNHYKNSFEEVGNGFGFTYNSPLFFLRIDHQFHSQGIEAVDYRIDRKMKISDHFPIRASYTFP